MRIQKLFIALIAVSSLVGWNVGQASAASLLDKVEAAAESLISIRAGLSERYRIYLNAEAEAAALEDRLEPVRATINTLAEQLQVLVENIRRTELNLDFLVYETASVQTQIADLFELAEVREAELQQTQLLLNEFLRLAYVQKMRYTDWQTGKISPFKFFLTEGSLADAETTQTYLIVLQTQTAELAASVQAAKELYQTTQGSLIRQRGRLIALQEAQITEQNRLQNLQSAKQDLLRQTRGEEKRYKELIEETRAQQAAVLVEIAELKDNLAVIDEKLSALGEDIGAERLRELLRQQGAAGGTNGLSFPGYIPQLAWPVDPGRGITSFFMDKEYRGIFGVDHYAIDYRVSQGTGVMAAGPGVVYKAKDNGMGYNYIIIAHSGGLSTLYGHVSKVLVREGDLVQAGELIALSGGTPGRPGSGYMTTGAHLHLEVFDQGKRSDPLDYLPLEQLRLEDVPAKYRTE